MALPFEFNAWTAVGFLGQAAFGSRFIVQWLVSEKKGECHIPVIFWYLSLVGGIILTIYAIGQKDIVFTLGQGLGVFIYIRNLMLIKKQKAKLESDMVTIQLHDDKKPDNH
jgi:lipid-A-disaccharide synthase-like uncharacterized protein